MRILAIYTHPADLACEASGTLALHVGRGDTVNVVIVTNGEDHHNVISENINGTKMVEASAVCSLLGLAPPHFLFTPDRTFNPSRSTALRISHEIEKLKPDIIITHMPISNAKYSGEHEVVGETVRRAIVLSKHKPDQAFYFPMDNSLDTTDMLCHGLVCDIWIDTTPVIKKKLAAINLIKSQGYDGKCARKIIEARDGRWGMLAGCSYAEPFLRARAQTYEHLPREKPPVTGPNGLQVEYKLLGDV